MADASFVEHLSKGDIVQISPDFYMNRAFAACLAVVDEVNSWGVQAYVQALGSERAGMGGQAYIRLEWDDFELTGGMAQWMPGDDSFAQAEAKP